MVDEIGMCAAGLRICFGPLPECRHWALSRTSVLRGGMSPIALSSMALCG